jgi:cobaltochelatase CobT
MIGFYNNFHYSGDWAVVGKEQESGLYNRFQALRLQVFKTFNQNLRTARAAIGAMKYHQDNGDSEAIRAVARRLAARPEPRKLLIVFSDGQPNLTYSNKRKLQKDTRAAVAETMKAGIEVIGVGITHDAVEHYYPHRIVVRNVSELPRKLMSLLKKFLTKGGKPTAEELRAFDPDHARRPRRIRR